MSDTATPHGGAASDSSLLEGFSRIADQEFGADTTNDAPLPSQRVPLREKQRREAAAPAAPAPQETPDAPDAPDEGQVDAAQPDAEPQEAPSLPFTTLDELAAELEVPVETLLALQMDTDVNGQKGRFSLGDIRKGFQLDAHNTQKAQELSKQHQKVQEMERTFNQAIEQNTQYLTTLNALGKYAQDMLHAKFQGVDWNRLRAEDPVNYGLLRQEFDDNERGIQEFLGQVQRQSQEQQAQAKSRQQAQFQRTLSEVRATRPEWADEAVFNKDCQAIKDTMLAQGFQPADIPLLLTSPAYLTAAWAATQWFNLQKSKPAAVARVKTAPPATKAQARRSQAPGTKLQQLKTRLRQNPNNQDVAAAAFGQYAEDAGLLT